MAQANCLKCQKGIDQKTQKLMKCSLCESLCHSVCEGITVKTYETLAKLKSLHWFCDKCNGAGLLNELREFRDFRAKHVELSNEISNYNTRICSLEEKLQQQPRNLSPSSYCAITKEEVSAQIREELEIDRRKLNLCVFGFPSSDDDKATFMDLCRSALNIQSTDVQSAIVSVLRVGGTDEQSTRPRPLIVKTSSSAAKHLILKAAPKLKNYNPNNSTLKVFIANDLTKNQQAVAKRLRDEVLRRRSQGENVVVRKGRIVQRETRPYQNGAAQRESRPHQNGAAQGDGRPHQNGVAQEGGHPHQNGAAQRESRPRQNGAGVGSPTLAPLMDPPARSSFIPTPQDRELRPRQ